MPADTKTTCLVIVLCDAKIVTPDADVLSVAGVWWSKVIAYQLSMG